MRARRRLGKARPRLAWLGCFGGLLVVACADHTLVRLLVPEAGERPASVSGGTGGAGAKAAAGAEPSQASAGLSGGGGSSGNLSGGRGGATGPCQVWRTWVLSFDSDPTATDHDQDGIADWALRYTGSFPVSQLSNGEWNLPKGKTYLLDTRPLCDFPGRTLVEARLRSLAVPGSPDNTVFWVNVNQHTQQASGIYVSVALAPGGGQTLELKCMQNATPPYVVLTTLTGLPEHLLEVRLDIDPPTRTVALAVDGRERGTYSFPVTGPPFPQRAATAASSGPAVYGRSTVRTCLE